MLMVSSHQREFGIGKHRLNPHFPTVGQPFQANRQETKNGLSWLSWEASELVEMEERAGALELAVSEVVQVYLDIRHHQSMIWTNQLCKAPQCPGLDIHHKWSHPPICCNNISCLLVQEKGSGKEWETEQGLVTEWESGSVTEWGYLHSQHPPNKGENNHCCTSLNFLLMDIHRNWLHPQNC